MLGNSLNQTPFFATALYDDGAITNRIASFHGTENALVCKHLLNSAIDHGARTTAHSRWVLVVELIWIDGFLIT